jgi:hypothetical protein
VRKKKANDGENFAERRTRKSKERMESAARVVVKNRSLVRARTDDACSRWYK